MAAIQGLDISDVAAVSITISPLAVPFRNFGALLTLGDSNIIDITERIRQYSGLTGVATDFGTSAPEYLAAQAFFAQKPKPSILYIGRWARTATKGLLHGAILTPTQQLLAGFNAVTTGAFNITLDGIPFQVTGLNFAAAANLNGVASTLQTALAALSAGTTAVWGAVHSRFDIQSGSSGVLSSVSYARTPTAAGNYVWSIQPANNAIITIQGTTITFVTGTPSGNQVKIGVDLATTLQNLLVFLQGSADVNLVLMNYWVSATKLYIESKATGTTGASYTIVAGSSPASNATASGATLAGGSGADISAVPLGFTAVSGASPLVPGIAAESLINCVTSFDITSSQWYGLNVASSVAPTTSDHLAVAAYIEGSTRTHIYGVTNQDTATLDSAQTSDLSSQLKSLGYERTFTIYSSSSPYAAASWYGRAFTVNFAGQNTTLTMKFKQLPGIAGELLTENQAATLAAKNCNVFVQYNTGTSNVSITQEGVMANGFFFDEVHDTDWLQNNIQTRVFNLFYQSPTKIAQTDPGTHKIVTEVEAGCVDAVRNGTLAPGVWNSDFEFGSLHSGDVLPTGYYVYAPPVATQAQADRETRVSVPIQVAGKLAGAIHKANVAFQINR